MKECMFAVMRSVAVAAAASSVAAATAAEGRVVVLTSFPEAFTAQYERAFERAYPGTRVELLWRASADGLAWLRRGGDREVDVYWTPSPGNFARLRDERRLARLAIADADLPGQIGGRSISDPEGFFAAFELAGFGIAYNPSVIRELGIAAPRDWSDLAAPVYAGKLHMPTPARTGFASALVEAILQAEGWDRGWALLSAIAGNAAWLGNPDSGGGPDPLANGRIAARLSIDFLARPAGDTVAFAYPPRTAYSPAHIAVMAEAQNLDSAALFVGFVLSPAGQSLLLHPDVARLPVRPSLYDAHPELGARPFADNALGYDSALTEARRGLVAALFDAVLVTPHAELVVAWQALHAAERDGKVGADVLREARRLLEMPPIDAAQAGPALRAQFASDVSSGSSAEQATVASGWLFDARSRIDAARSLLERSDP